MFPKGLILAILVGVISGPIIGIFLYEFGIEEQLVYVDGTSLSIVTEKTNLKKLLIRPHGKYFISS